MGIGAIVLGVFAFICMIGGAVLAWVPFLGTMLSFLAPVLALAGIILGGVALSRAKSGGGESEGFAIGGLVTSIIAFVPSVLVALTCGLCNTCATAMYLDPSIGAYDSGRHDGGVLSNGAIPPPPPFPSGPPPFPTTLAPAPSGVAPPPDTTLVPPTTAPAPDTTGSTAGGTTTGGMPPPPLPPGPGT